LALADVERAPQMGNHLTDQVVLKST